MKNEKYIISGFKASAVAAGIKNGNALDLALIFSEREATVAGAFTTNKVKAAPVILSLEHVEGGKAKAIIANSGNANACTGKTGLNDARLTAELVAKELGVAFEEVVVASTGVIGKPLDMDLITGAIPGLVETLSPDGIPDAARAIMTTDSFSKISMYKGLVGDVPFHILGIAKGAGMIMPHLSLIHI